MIADRCPHCGLPILDANHTHHTPSCGIEHDGCNCPPVHGWCCPTCTTPTRKDTP